MIDGYRHFGYSPAEDTDHAGMARQHTMNLMSSTLLSEDTGLPFHQLQAEQIQRFKDAWQAAGQPREPRVSVSRSIFPIVNSVDRAYFGRQAGSEDQVGYLDSGVARFGKTYAGEPDPSWAGADCRDLEQIRAGREPGAESLALLLGPGTGRSDGQELQQDGFGALDPQSGQERGERISVFAHDG